MGKWIDVMLNNSIRMSIVIILLLLLSTLFFKKSSAKWRYYTWLIVIVGLLIPFRPFPDIIPIRIELPVQITAQNTTPVIVDLVEPDGLQINNTPMDEISTPSVPMEKQAFSFSWPALVMTIWAIGFLAFLVYCFVKHRKFLKAVSRWSCDVDRSKISTILDESKVELGITKDLLVKTCKIVSTPMLIGLIEPVILLPPNDFEYDELELIIRHELTHYKRNDLWYKALVLFTNAVHWFNPFVYLMARSVSVDCEMSCDEAVLIHKDVQERMLYGETIISIVKNQSAISTVFSTGFMGGKKDMEKRMFSIIDTKKKKAGVMVLCIVLACTVLTGMGVATPTQKSDNAAPSTSAQQNDKTIPNSIVDTKQVDVKKADKYSIYRSYGLTYNADEDRMYYNDQIVRCFVDRFNNGQGVLNMWGYDLEGTIDLYAVRNDVGLQGELTGIKAYSQEDFDLRTKEIEAEQNNIPDYDIMTFRFKKDEAPESLQLWIRQCENDVFDFCATQQNGRYYIYVRGETGFGFSVKVDGDEASMTISRIDGIKGDGYALFSVPLYKRFSVTYNGTHKSFLQD